MLEGRLMRLLARSQTVMESNLGSCVDVEVCGLKATFGTPDGLVE